MRVKVVIIQEVFSNYRGPVFDRLNKRYALSVLHGKKKSDLKLIEKPYSREVRSSYLLGGRFVFLHVASELRKLKPDVIIHQGSPGIVSIPFTWLWSRFNKCGFVVWTHGFERHQGFRPYRSFRSFLRLMYFKMADGIIFYTEQRKIFFEKILPAEKLFFATNTIDTQQLLTLRAEFEKNGAENLKKPLRMDGYFNIVFIGRLLKDKLTDHLLRATQLIKQRGIKVKAHIIGNGEEKETLVTMTNDLSLQDDVIFYGAIYDEAVSGKILYCSDVMCMPGYIGLAINHAYCFDLPVVTYKQGSAGPYHSPEIDYLEPQRTGLLIDSYNCETLAAELIRLAKDPDLLGQYKRNVREKIKQLSIEAMEGGFEKCINYVIARR